jgi:hypothetical protein
MTKKTKSQLDREIVEVLTGAGAETISGVVDGIQYTRAGYQITTIDGVTYKTLFDAAGPLAPREGSWIEATVRRNSSPGDPYPDIPYANITRVVDPKGKESTSKASKQDHAVVRSKINVGDELVVVRDSEDLGMSKGTRMRVVWADSHRMDVDVPSLDMRYSGLSVHHPDIVRAPKDWAASEDIRKIARWKTARSSKPWSRGKRP